MKEFNDSTFFIPHWIKPPYLHAAQYSMKDLEFVFSNVEISFVVKGNVTVNSYHYVRDQYKIEALLFKQNNCEMSPAIIFINGFEKTALDFFARCITFARAGYTGLAITMPGFGRSEGPRDWVGFETIKSITEGYTKLKKEHFVDANRIGVFGFSRGALAAALLVTGKIECKAAIFASGLYDFQKAYDSSSDKEMKDNMRRETGMTEKAILERSPIFAMNKIDCPVLILHGDADNLNSVEQARLLAQKLYELNKPNEKEIYNNVGHGLNGTNYIQRCIYFFNRTLKSENYQ